MQLRYLSLFSGIDAASVAWMPLGWKPVAFAEISPFACAALSYHYPQVPNLGDITRITERQVRDLGHIDVVVFGSPCQDLSVAGKRAGLKGQRSGLFFDAMRIVRWSGARFALFENVPGLFSSHDGRDFAAVVGAMAGMELDVPRDGWRNTGVALGRDGIAEWAVLDAQFFGVPQRRRRIFALRDIGDWRSRPPILLIPDSLRGYPAPRREARPGVARGVAVGPSGGEFTETSCTLDSRAKDGAIRNQLGMLVAPLVAHCANVSRALTSSKTATGRLDPNEQEFVVHTLRAEGFDASDDGGRGIPLVPIAFSCKDHGADVGETAPTLRSMGFDKSHANAGGQVAVAFTERGREQGRTFESQDDLAYCLTNPGSGGRTHSRQLMDTTSAVRRLTPEECEALQGLPRGYTKVPYRGKPAADGPRYAAIGNSMAVPVMRWIGERIQVIHEATNSSQLEQMSA